MSTLDALRANSVQAESEFSPLFQVIAFSAANSPSFAGKYAKYSYLCRQAFLRGGFGLPCLDATPRSLLQSNCCNIVTAAGLRPGYSRGTERRIGGWPASQARQAMICTHCGRPMIRARGEFVRFVLDEAGAPSKPADHLAASSFNGIGSDDAIGPVRGN